MMSVRRLVLASVAVLAVACAQAGASTPTPTPPVSLPRGVYVYHPTPLVWEMVTVTENGTSGAVFEWSCTGQRWAIGTIPASVHDTFLQFGDDRYAIAAGLLDARWRAGGIDPRALPAPICAGATPTTKALLSTDAARLLFFRGDMRALYLELVTGLSAPIPGEDVLSASVRVGG